ncbi:penicillin-binding protein [Patescibacteria group bacterium]|nr:penicillin-binding protein [Patescibacteria group bacterium]MCL5798072.1 penicillin-binding protein [Patescibacteria group bacterium]
MKNGIFVKAGKLKSKQIFYKKKFIFIIVVAMLCLSSIYYLFSILKDLPSPTKLSLREVPQTTKIFDRNGTLLYNIYANQNRTLVKLAVIPISLREATIAIEDKDFYKHGGIDPIGGIIRAVRDTLLRRQLQGGSTITQQLVKNALLTPERTVTRKIREIILSYWTEKLYSKDQILEMYLNQVPYGGTAWGIEAAAQTYFGIHAKDLDLAQSTLLAGLPQAPTIYSPFGAHPEYAIQRQREVLQRMVDDGYIGKDQMEKAENEILHFRPQQTDIKAPHFVMYIKEQLVNKYGEKIVEQGGLKVTTTLDLPLQEMAQDTVASEVAKLKALNVSNGAVVITRPTTGEILAMVGSKDYFASDSGNFNVTTALRQPGSSIKPINYAIGLESHKVTASTVFLDTPTCFDVAGQKPYCPVNYDGKFHGPVQLRFALGNSINIPAVKMMAVNSVKTMIATASAMGITTYKDPSKYGLSLTLGGGDVTMLDMAQAYGVFANTGIRRDLISILKVEDNNGKTLEEYKDPNFVKDVEKPLNYPSSILISGPRIFSMETSFLISHILLDNNARTMEFGPDSALVIPKHAVSVKTGTTDDKRDNWTIGYTPNFLVATWVGNNDNSPMNPFLASGITGAAPIWNKVMTSVLKNQPDIWPRQPDGIVGAQICSLSGLTPPNSDPNASDKGCATRYEYFIKGTVPTEPEHLEQTIAVDKTTHKMASPNQTDNVSMEQHQVVSDMFGKYCLDCSHDGGDPITNIKL